MVNFGGWEVACAGSMIGRARGGTSSVPARAGPWIAVMRRLSYRAHRFSLYVLQGGLRGGLRGRLGGGLGATTLALSLGAASYLVPASSQACGGTFCDGATPTPMPVDQTGETVIFAVDGDTIEAHIQIEYDPDAGAQSFAWVIPLPAVPELAVSSDDFFDRMRSATVPVFGFSSQSDSCGGSGSDGGWGSCDSTGAESSGDTGGSDDGGQTGNPEVLDRGIVGAFEYAVLSGGTVEGVMTWLENGQYDPDPNAEPILAQYLEEGQLFLALKLRPSEGASSIHPIRLRYLGDEFCVPLRLTAIAAAEDMAARVLVLGAERAAPANWVHVVPNPVAFDWVQVGANYQDVLSLAFDSASVNGHGWATEYAGPSAIVPIEGLVDPRWDVEAFAGITPYEFIPLLEGQGILATCEDPECEPGHPLGPSMLAQFLPPPDGVDPNAFYDCLECYAGLIDADAFDPVKIQATLTERIVEPATHALGLLETHAYLTRMVTLLSPWEMTEDPTFHMNPDLEPVPLPPPGQRSIDCSFNATFVVDYFARFEFRLPSGPGSWPTFENMPSTLRVERIAAVGAPQVELDNEAAIRALLTPGDTTPAAVLEPRSHDDCGSPHGSESGDGASAQGEEEGGCTCRSDRGGGWGTSSLAIFGLLALRRRSPKRFA